MITSYKGGSLNVEEPTLLLFQAKWCNPCKVFQPNIEEVANKRSINLIKIDTDLHPDLCKKFTVQGVPTTVILDATGKELGRKVGALAPKTLNELVDLCLNT